MELLGVITLVLFGLWTVSKLRRKLAPISNKNVRSSVRISLAEILPPELAQLEVEDHYVVRVAGVSYENDDGSSRQEILACCKVPEILQLVRQPNHRHDRNAIQVRRQNGEMLGFIPREDACLMAPELDKGRQYVAVLVTLDGGYWGKPALAADVLIVKIKEWGSA